MHLNFVDIYDNPPTIFAEDVYLCNHLGDVITLRCGTSHKISNTLSILTNNDVRFIRENMSFPGTRPLMLVDSSAGPIIFDLSLCPRYSLLIAIVPHIGKDELLSLVKSGELARINLSDGIKSQLEDFSSVEISHKAMDFAERASSLHRYTEYAKFFLQTNIDMIDEICEISRTFGMFYGCRVRPHFHSIRNDVEFANEICLESYSFAMAMLTFLARNFSATREADMDIYCESCGIYFDFYFDIAEQFSSSELIFNSPELAYFVKRANEMFLTHFYTQNENHFKIRVLPWLRRPDSADLKEIKEKFIYDC